MELEDAFGAAVTLHGEARTRSDSLWSAASSAKRDRSDSLWSTVSSTYSYPESVCDASSVAVARASTRDGRGDEDRHLAEAMARSLADPPEAATRAPRHSFFSAAGAPLDVQLRIAAALTCVADITALQATSTWTRRPMWRVATVAACGGFPSRSDALPLAEAAAAALVTCHLGGRHRGTPR